MKRLAALLLGLGVVVTVPSVAAEPAAATPIHVRAAAAAPALPTISSVTDMGSITQNPRVDTTNSGRDEGQSTDYEGSSVWAFDDTTLGNPWGFLSNTGAVTSNLDATNGVTLTSATPYDQNNTATPQTLLPLTAAEQAFQDQHSTSTGCTSSTDQYCGASFALWPGGVIADPANSRVLVFYAKLCRGGGSGTPCSGFLGKVLGSGIAALNMNSGTATRLDATGLSSPIQSVEGADPALFFPPGQLYGTATAVVVSNALYAYGDCGTYQCKLATVPLADITDVGRWTYYTGSDSSGAARWSSSEPAAVYAADTGSSGMNIQWDPGLAAYLDTYMQPLTDNAKYEVGTTPWGPWSAAGTMFTGAAPVGGNLGFDYALYAHPEFAQWNGLTQFITYYHSGPGEQRLEKVTFNPPTFPPSGPIVSGVSPNLCVDDSGSSTANGNVVQIYTCNTTGAQNWGIEPDGTVRVLTGCLDVADSGTSPGTKADFYQCNGTGAQQWREGPVGELVNPESGLCLDDPGSTTIVGTQLQIYPCNGTAAQDWTLP